MEFHPIWGKMNKRILMIMFQISYFEIIIFKIIIQGSPRPPAPGMYFLGWQNSDIKKTSRILTRFLILKPKILSAFGPIILSCEGKTWTL